MEIVSFIKGDLERLYMSGVEDEYFKSTAHSNMLLNILFIWVTRHRKTGYRQGMHEIVAPVLLVLQQERQAWTTYLSQAIELDPSFSLKSKGLHTLAKCFSEEFLEASVFWIFEKIMTELESLYRPVTGGDEQPFVVHYCTRIQGTANIIFSSLSIVDVLWCRLPTEHMLRSLDPELCSHLEDNYIQAQLYGMRWARLLLGREFQCNETGLLRLWDYMFACVLHHSMQQQQSKQEELPIYTAEPTNKSKSAKSHPLEQEDSDDDEIIWTTTSAAMKAQARSGPASPLLDALGDFMLAMLLHVGIVILCRYGSQELMHLQIRDELIEGDSSQTLTLLMRYPLVEDVTPIVDLADMIRR